MAVLQRQLGQGEASAVRRVGLADAGPDLQRLFQRFAGTCEITLGSQDLAQVKKSFGGRHLVCIFPIECQGTLVHLSGSRQVAVEKQNLGEVVEDKTLIEFVADLAIKIEGLSVCLLGLGKIALAL